MRDWITELYVKEMSQTKLNFMDAKQYQEIINKTAVFPKEIGLAYCSLGLLDELGEYIEKVKDGALHEDREKEAGDVFWYITALSKELGSSLENLLNFKVTPKVFVGKTNDDEILNLYLIGSQIQGKIKKIYRDKDENKKIEALALLASFTKHFHLFITGDNLDLIPVLEKNYDKLIARRETNTLHGDGDNREE